MSDTILVKFRRGNKEIPVANIKFVGGTEGVFATYQDGDTVHFLGGDDGSWWELADYNVYWCGHIAKNIQEYTTKFGEKQCKT